MGKGSYREGGWEMIDDLLWEISIEFQKEMKQKEIKNTERLNVPHSPPGIELILEWLREIECKYAYMDESRLL